jgi:hypothetical protein
MNRDRLYTYTVCHAPNALGLTGDWLIYDGDSDRLVGRMAPETARRIYGALQLHPRTETDPSTTT